MKQAANNKNHTRNKTVIDHPTSDSSAFMTGILKKRTLSTNEVTGITVASEECCQSEGTATGT